MIEGRAARKMASETTLAYDEGRKQATVTGDEKTLPRRKLRRLISLKNEIPFTDLC